MNRVDKIKFWFSLLFRLLLVFAGVLAIIGQDWINLALAVVTMILTFMPNIIEKRVKVDYPSELEIIILFFIGIPMYLGEIQGFYKLFWWWDLFLHSFSGLIIGVIGFSLVYVLNQGKKELNLSAGFIATFSFCFAIALGVIWEVFEFFMDSFMGLNMQKSGLVDTMWDLIVNLLGAGIVAVIGYLYLRKDPGFLKKLEKKFIKYQ